MSVAPDTFQQGCYTVLHGGDDRHYWLKVQVSDWVVMTRRVDVTPTMDIPQLLADTLRHADLEIWRFADVAPAVAAYCDLKRVWGSLALSNVRWRTIESAGTRWGLLYEQAQQIPLLWLTSPLNRRNKVARLTRLHPDFPASLDHIPLRDLVDIEDWNGTMATFVTALQRADVIRTRASKKGKPPGGKAGAWLMADAILHTSVRLSRTTRETALRHWVIADDTTHPTFEQKGVACGLRRYEDALILPPDETATPCPPCEQKVKAWRKQGLTLYSL